MTTAVYADKDSKKDRDDNKDSKDNNQGFADDEITSEKIKDSAVGLSVRQVFGSMITIEAVGMLFLPQYLK
jgi:hypothetical protein